MSANHEAYLSGLWNTNRNINFSVIAFKFLLLVSYDHVLSYAQNFSRVTNIGIFAKTSFKSDPRISIWCLEDFFRTNFLKVLADSGNAFKKRRVENYSVTILVYVRDHSEEHALWFIHNRGLVKSERSHNVSGNCTNTAKSPSVCSHQSICSKAAPCQVIL